MPFDYLDSVSIVVPSPEVAALASSLRMSNLKIKGDRTMSEISCPIPTFEERKFSELREQIERKMLDTIYNAIDKATISMAEQIKASKIGIEAVDRDYFTATAQQNLFVRLCGGNPDTLQGGDPDIGQQIVNNAQAIIDRYWQKIAEGS